MTLRPALVVALGFLVEQLRTFLGQRLHRASVPVALWVSSIDLGDTPAPTTFPHDRSV